jgi:hypothetical protein
MNSTSVVERVVSFIAFCPLLSPSLGWETLEVGPTAAGGVLDFSGLHLTYCSSYPIQLIPEASFRKFRVYFREIRIKMVACQCPP